MTVISVAVVLHHELDGIYNHHGNIHTLGVPVRAFLERFNRTDKSHPECSTVPYAEVLVCIKRRKQVSLGFLTTDTM